MPLQHRTPFLPVLAVPRLAALLLQGCTCTGWWPGAASSTLHAPPCPYSEQRQFQAESTELAARLHEARTDLQLAQDDKVCVGGSMGVWSVWGGRG